MRVTLAPPREYDESIAVAAAMRAVATTTVATYLFLKASNTAAS